MKRSISRIMAVILCMVMTVSSYPVEALAATDMTHTIATDQSGTGLIAGDEDVADYVSGDVAAADVSVLADEDTGDADEVGSAGVEDDASSESADVADDTDSEGAGVTDDKGSDAADAAGETGADGADAADEIVSGSDADESAVDEIEVDEGSDGETDDVTDGAVSADDTLVSEDDQTDSETAGAIDPAGIRIIEPEYHVGPAYEGIYTDEDIRLELEDRTVDYSSYSLEQLAGTLTGLEPLSATAEETGILNAMKARQSSYSYVSSSFDPGGLINKALSETSAQETDPTGGDYIKANFCGWSASASGYGGAWNITVQFSYMADASQEKKVDAKVKELVTDLGLKSTAYTDEEKVKAIHDYLVNTITYTNDGTLHCHSTHAALLSHKCVCQGYASAFLRLCREAGIAAKYIVDDGSINHAWNIVKLYSDIEGASVWYNMDVTWDDPVNVEMLLHRYYLKCPVEFPGHPRKKEYDTNKFHNTHPMALYTWGKDSAGSDVSNYNVTFTDVNGTERTTTAEGKPKFLIFYRNTCSRSQSTVKAFVGSVVSKRKAADIFALNVDNASASSVKDFASKYASGAGMVFATNSGFKDMMWKKYIYPTELAEPGETIGLPVVAMINADNTVKFVTSGLLTKYDIDRIYMRYLLDGWDPDARTKSVAVSKFTSAEAAEAGTPSSAIKDGKTVKLKYGETIWIKAKGKPNKSDLALYDDTVTIKMTGATGSISYDADSGRIEALKGSGSIKVTCTSNFDGSAKTVFTLKLVPAPILSISLDKTSLTMNPGGEPEWLHVSYNPEITSDDKTIRWTSSNPDVATVETDGAAAGKVTPKANGTTYITAKCMSKTAKCRVTVITPVESIAISDGESLYNKPTNNPLPMIVGQQITFKAVVSPANATIRKGIEWDCPDDDLAAVSIKVSPDLMNLTVKAVRPKTDTPVTISVKADDLTPVELRFKVYSCSIRFETGGGELPEGTGSERAVSYSGTLGELPVPKYEGHCFDGWYTEQTGGRRVSGSTLVSYFYKISPGCALDAETIPLYAHWTESSPGTIRIGDIPNYTYTGKEIKPHPDVYCGTHLLKEGTDYTISYSNNKNAYNDDPKPGASVPTVTVKGKNNFSGSDKAYFRILPKDIHDADIVCDASSITVTENGRAQKITPVLKRGKTKLKIGRDYILPDEADRTFTSAGVYPLVIKAAPDSNYKHERTIYVTVNRGDFTPLSKCKIHTAESVRYDAGNELKPAVTVKNGKTRLTEGVDYVLTYRNNINIGTATVTASGIGAYTGTRTAKFKIKGTDISKAVLTLTPAADMTYNGSLKDIGVTVKLKKSDAEALVPDVDYTVSYSTDRIKAGKCKVTVKGRGAYTGTVKKTIKINKRNISAATVAGIDGNADIRVTYVKGGATPELKVTYNGMELKKDTDYTLKYSNNKSVYDKDPAYDRKGKTNAPAVTITGKGNYSGKRTVYFKIASKALNDIWAPVRMKLSDAAYSGKPGKWKPALTLTDTNGKALKAGTDYEVLYTYAENAIMKDGSERAKDYGVTSRDCPMPGTLIAVEVRGKGNYSDDPEHSLKGRRYRIFDPQYSISGINFKIEDQIYTGDAITLTKDDIVYEAGAGHESFDRDCFEITGYSKNIHKGTATVTLTGYAPYGGTCKVKFKIKTREIKR